MDGDEAAVEHRRAAGHADHVLFRLEVAGHLGERREQPVGRNRLQVPRLVRAQPDLREQQLGLAGRIARIADAQHRAALDDRAVEEPLGVGHREQGRDLPSAAGLAEHGHPGRVAAERLDVVAHPLEGGDDVEHARAAGRREVAAGQLGEVRRPEDVEAVVEGDDDHVAPVAQVDAVVGAGRPRAGAEAAAVQPHHDRVPAAVAEPPRPHVEEEAVLAGDGLGAALRRRRAVLQGVAHAGPRRRRGGRHEPVPPARRCAVADALEDVDTRPRRAADAARGRLDGRAGIHVLSPCTGDQGRHPGQHPRRAAGDGEARNPTQECAPAPGIGDRGYGAGVVLCRHAKTPPVSSFGRCVLQLDRRGAVALDRRWLTSMR